MFGGVGRRVVRMMLAEERKSCEKSPQPRRSHERTTVEGLGGYKYLDVVSIE